MQMHFFEVTQADLENVHINIILLHISIRMITGLITLLFCQLVFTKEGHLPKLKGVINAQFDGN